MKISVRAANVLFSALGRDLGRDPTPAEVYAAADKNGGGDPFMGLRKWKNCGLVLAAEIAEYAGIPVPDKLGKTKCPTCGRVRPRLCKIPS